MLLHQQMQRLLAQLPTRWSAHLVVRALVIFVLAVTLFYTLSANLRSVNSQTASQFHSESSASPAKAATKLHILLPASNPEVNLCKTLLGLSILGYEAPTLVSWNSAPDTNDPALLGGGTHLRKISAVLDHLSNLLSRPNDEQKDKDNSQDLVLMIDAYDVWPQLPPSTLIRRYDSIVKHRQDELARRVGQKAVDEENLRTSVIFGAGKRCAPNQLHTIACYPVPESGLPDDLYHDNTDTVIGRNQYYSHRQRFLNSGYVIGPLSEVHKIFKEAKSRMDEQPEVDPQDNGSHGSDRLYHGSDQSIFAAMFGRQEWAREVYRIRHTSWWDIIRHPKTCSKKPRSSWIYGLFVDNKLEPSFTHEHMDATANALPFEFGITLDYWSDLGHQTVNSEQDARWLIYPDPEATSHSLQELEGQVQGRNAFDCKLRLPDGLPTDIVETTIAPWNSVPLYTHICLARIPVFIHHNGDKSARERNWGDMWYIKNGHARMSLNLSTPGAISGDVRQQDTRRVAAMPSGKFLSWSDVCPEEWSSELFRNA